jgi:hypothetical protein
LRVQTETAQANAKRVPGVQKETPLPLHHTRLLDSMRGLSLTQVRRGPGGSGLPAARRWSGGINALLPDLLLPFLRAGLYSAENKKIPVRHNTGAPDWQRNGEFALELRPEMPGISAGREV